MRTVRFLLQAGATISALFLIACAHPVAGPEDALSPQQRFPISFEPQMQVFHLPYDSSAAPDSVIERELYDIGRDYLENGAGSISVSATPENASAAEHVVGELAAAGVPHNRIMVVPPGREDAPHTVAIDYIRYRAISPACGNWSENLAYTYDNRPSPNLGCATQHNIAAMISDPRDLAMPEPEGTEDAARRLTILGKYEQGDNTQAKKSLGPAEEYSSMSAGGSGGGM